MMTEPVCISFTELSHTEITVDANYFPLGCGFVAAYAAENLGPEISVDIFKYPKDFTDYLQTVTPRFACFSNYSWSFNLTYEYALQIKQKHSEAITVFGGPNYPIEAPEQEKFLRRHPAIDFYVDGEGEIAFVELYKKLASSKFDVERFKKEGTLSSNTHYICGERFLCGEMLPRIQDVNTIPSPFLNGMFDKFFDSVLTPLLQSHRGCPYSCAFCRDGIDYMNKVRRFSQERIENEIKYIFDHRKVPNICFADLNFGMFKKDLDTTRLLSQLQEASGWPKFVEAAVAKNHKQRVTEMANALHGGFYVGAALQSTDPDVLENIQRGNVHLDQLIGMAQESTQGNNPSYSEIILCLPGDSKEKHFKSVFDILDIGIDEIRSYQFVLLAGTVGASREYRDRFGYETSFRVLPRCFGTYDACGDPFEVFEYHEICVGNNTMTHQDYEDARKFNLMVEIFNNGGLFKELLIFLERHNISRSTVFRQLLSSLQKDKVLSTLFKKFMADENKNFWQSEDEIKEFLRQPDSLEKYKSGEYGANQIMEYRSRALLEHMDTVASTIFDVSKELLGEAGHIDENIMQYLGELQDFILFKKGDLFSPHKQSQQNFHFDFIELSEKNFQADPFAFRTPGGLEIKFSHSEDVLEDIEAYFKQYGQTVAGFGHFLHRGALTSLFREARYA
jgi:radical SAM superfamily enzyme YgiQ (UPF0313 family)